MGSNFGRRTWNKEDYILDYKSSGRDNDHLRNLSDAQLQVLKAKYTNYDQLMKDSIKGLNQRTLFSNVSEYKRGKQFGFYCDLCNLTFKDTLQYVDHLNSKPHQIKFTTLFHEELILNARDNDDIPIDEFKNGYLEQIKHFVKTHNVNQNTSEFEGRRKRNKQRKQNLDEPRKPPTDSELNQMMGFASFGSTKK